MRITLLCPVSGRYALKISYKKFRKINTRKSVIRYTVSSISSSVRGPKNALSENIVRRVRTVTIEIKMPCRAHSLANRNSKPEFQWSSRPAKKRILTRKYSDHLRPPRLHVLLCSRRHRRVPAGRSVTLNSMRR